MAILKIILISILCISIDILILKSNMRLLIPLITSSLVFPKIWSETSWKVSSVLRLSSSSGKAVPCKVSYCTVSLSLFAGPERILRRFSIFAEEPCKSIITTTEPCNPVFKEAQPRPSWSV